VKTLTSIWNGLEECVELFLHSTLLDVLVLVHNVYSLSTYAIAKTSLNNRRQKIIIENKNNRQVSQSQVPIFLQGVLIVE
jgi:hypothetical protein